MKTYVKTKEFGPVGGGGRAPETFVCRSATGKARRQNCISERHTVPMYQAKHISGYIWRVARVGKMIALGMWNVLFSFEQKYLIRRHPCGKKPSVIKLEFFFFFLVHLVYQPKSLIQSCFVCRRHWYRCWHHHLCSPPSGTRVRHRNFIFCIHMHICPLYVHIKYLVILTCSF